MTKKSITLRIAALKPRNPFASLARRRAAGAHQVDKRSRNDPQKDLLQRLREAGL
ncbi:MAG: hypothetical protein RLZZ584_1124 [Pseudomonadota bacterium]